MTADPLTAVLDQLAACREHLAQLDDREAAHFTAVSEQLAQLAGLITTMGRTLAGDTAALARLEALDRQVTELTAQLGADGTDRYQPAPSPAWQSLTPGQRQPAIAGLRAWVEQVYRPSYGHLATALGPCWEQHPLCLFGLYWLMELWSVLYLKGGGGTSTLASQAEWQTRLLPALAEQMRVETSRCRHARQGRQFASVS